MDYVVVTGGEGGMKETNVTQIKICHDAERSTTSLLPLSRIDNQTLICPDCGDQRGVGEH